MNRRGFFQIAAGLATACKVGLPAARESEILPVVIQPPADWRRAGISARVLPWNGAGHHDVMAGYSDGKYHWGLPNGIEVINPGRSWFLRLTVQIVDADGNEAPAEYGCGGEVALHDFEDVGRGVCNTIRFWTFNPKGCPFAVARFRLHNYSRGGYSTVAPAWDGKPYRDVVFGESPSVYLDNPGFDTGIAARASWVV